MIYYNTYGEGYIDSYWSTLEKAENYILKNGILDQGHYSVEVEKIEMDKEGRE